MLPQTSRWMQSRENKPYLDQAVLTLTSRTRSWSPAFPVLPMAVLRVKAWGVMIRLRGSRDAGLGCGFGLSIVHKHTALDIDWLIYWWMDWGFILDMQSHLQKLVVVLRFGFRTNLALNHLDDFDKKFGFRGLLSQTLYALLVPAPILWPDLCGEHLMWPRRTETLTFSPTSASSNSCK